MRRDMGRNAWTVVMLVFSVIAILGWINGFNTWVDWYNLIAYPALWIMGAWWWSPRLRKWLRS